MPVFIGNRVSILTLCPTGKTAPEVAELLQINVRTVRSILTRAIKRGFEPNHRPLWIIEAFYLDAPRTGRLRKQTEEVNRIFYRRYTMTVMVGRKPVLISPVR